MIRGRSAETSDGEGAPDDPYREVRDALVATSPEDLVHQLPNLVETVANASREPETERFLIGVSFSREHAPLDYELARIVAGEDGGDRRESLKDAVSGTHYYLRFSYPSDTRFDACALRGALLSALEAELSGGNGAVPAEGSGEERRDGSLSKRLYGRLATLF